MRKLLIAIWIGVGAMVVAGCIPKHEHLHEKEAKELFAASANLTMFYFDSLLNAKDSATVQRISNELQEGLTKLNFSYPAETYLSISEGQNDTLTRLTQIFVTLRDSMLYELSKMPRTASDSLRRDTVAFPKLISTSEVPSGD